MQRQKPTVPASTAINWYFGNYIQQPHNALRRDEDESWYEEINKLADDLKKEFEGKRMTHREFLNLMKERGIHEKYYHYKRAEPPDCPLCRYIARISKK